ncbi:MAG TPA: acyl-CoA desaturase [Cyclobacteriaceae bacterium]|nr:acyl-CoA desaturase [Cyclobacteriaceae bacterium]
MNLNLKFAPGKADFFLTLSQRVNSYFKNNNIERTANIEMVVKTVFMFSLYLIPYFIVISGVVTNLWGMFGLCCVMGLGIAGIGLSVMHDANHGSYSSKTWVNDLLGISLNIIGGHAINWKVQHNVLHHTYTNVHDVDEDISPRGVLRMAPGSDWKPMHRYQHLYAWFFYGLLTLVWVVNKDFSRLVKYDREGLLKKQKTTAQREWLFLIASKVLYISYVIVLPIILLPVTWWQVLIGFFVMHYIAGFILAIIFQPAHVIDGTEYPIADENGNLENNWAIHQLHTTTNFGHKNKLLSWYVGGLNYQVEHHLFPNVCHVHYRKLAPIVEQTAKEFGLPYKSKETFLEAVADHAKLMKELGIKPALAPSMSLA